MKGNNGKTRRIGKHHFRLIGKDNLYFKGEHIVSFAPLNKGYISIHVVNSSKIEKSSLLSIMIGNFIPMLSNSLQPPLITTNKSKKNIKKEQLKH